MMDRRGAPKAVCRGALPHHSWQPSSFRLSNSVTRRIYGLLLLAIVLSAVPKHHSAGSELGIANRLCICATLLLRFYMHVQPYAPGA